MNAVEMFATSVRMEELSCNKSCPASVRLYKQEGQGGYRMEKIHTYVTQVTKTKERNNHKEDDKEGNLMNLTFVFATCRSSISIGGPKLLASVSCLPNTTVIGRPVSSN